MKRARVNACSFEQTSHIHYNSDDKALPVVNMIIFRIILILWVSYRQWNMEMLHVKGTFLKGNFAEGEKHVYLEVPQGFKHIYKQIGKELEAGEILEGKKLEREMEIHKQ